VGEFGGDGVEEIALKWHGCVCVCVYLYLSSVSPVPLHHLLFVVVLYI
jgi:hypothetical protein